MGGGGVGLSQEGVGGDVGILPWSKCWRGTQS